MSRMYYREQKYIYGNYLEVNMFPVFSFPRSSRRRRKHRASRDVQKRLNQINAEKKLSRMIPLNFTNRDLKYELTYSDQNYPQDFKQAQRDIQNFFRRWKNARAKAGLPEGKYIYAFGEGALKGRIHFHVISTGGLDLMTIQKIWGKGYVNKVAPLMFDEQGCVGIAKYFCQQQAKASESGTSSIEEKTVKRWVSSRNCIKPQPVNDDYKLTKRKVRDYAENCECRALFEKNYPGYFFYECRPFWNDETGAYYLTVRMYRKNSDLDLETLNFDRKKE